MLILIEWATLVEFDCVLLRGLPGSGTGVWAALQAERRVLVANTQVQLWEMAAVIGAARLAGRTLCFVECRGDWSNVYGLSELVLASMRSR